jgi:CheY-like chemotaxis protein
VSSATDMAVVGEAVDGESALLQARQTRPDVVLMDIRMPGTDGISATQLITADPDLADVKVLVLTTAELAQVAAENPFLRAAGAGFDEKSLHATFLEEPVPEAAFAGLALPTQPGEQAEIAQGGRVIYLDLPHGYGRTKLNNSYFERHLGAVATTRNWRTVLALAEMSAG